MSATRTAKAQSQPPAQPAKPIAGQRTIDGFLAMATAALQAAGIASARLDSELLLGHVLDQPREYLLAHGDVDLGANQWQDLCLLLARRVAREPLAYLIGYKYFYGRCFIVTPDVLIPRPETEQLIDKLSSLLLGVPVHLADIGTGSGCLAITAKLEHPLWQVTASDISPAALAVARQNAQQLQADVDFCQSDLLAQYPFDQPLDVIVANLPYLDKSWHDVDSSPELASEPDQALYAADHGNDLIKKLLFTAQLYLCSGGYLLLELDPRQVSDIIAFAQEHGYRVVDQRPFMLVLQT